MDNRQNFAALDEAVILLDRLRALTALLAVEEVVSEFAALDVTERTAIFGLLECTATTARDAIAREGEAR
jgi:hypothetical protein